MPGASSALGGPADSGASGPGGVALITVAWQGAAGHGSRMRRDIWPTHLGGDDVRHLIQAVPPGSRCRDCRECQRLSETHADPLRSGSSCLPATMHTRSDRRWIQDPPELICCRKTAVARGTSTCNQTCTCCGTLHNRSEQTVLPIVLTSMRPHSLT